MNKSIRLRLLSHWGLFGLSLIFVFSFSACSSNADSNRIDRHALVTRHNVLVEEFDSLASLTVGNGNFAFTTDFTGLQTFYKEYENGVSLGTQSNWGWHSLPNDENFDISETYVYHDVEGRKVPYESQLGSSERAMNAANYFRVNPHRLHLGVIRLLIHKKNGEEIGIKDIELPKHFLNLWNGEITSNFEIEGIPVLVEVFCHQQKDMLAVRIESELIRSKQLVVEWLFPYGTTAHTHAGYNFDLPEKHTSEIVQETAHSVLIDRKLDDETYSTEIQWKGQAGFQEVEKHHFILKPSPDVKELEFCCLFSPDQIKEELPDFESTKQNNESAWADFWNSGGAVDFSACTDPRAKELERRTVLSQYLTKVNGSGDLPPQETGLTFNSWYGKFHLEMIWWHSAQFYNWQRPQYLANQLKYFQHIYPQALTATQKQGYKGVRWPKMVGPEGKNSPSSIGSYLIWQQPHLIYLAEQLYQSAIDTSVLETYGDLIFSTADFMADFARYDSISGVYNLAPPLIPAQEHWNCETTINPPFELAYWYWGLTVAQKWKERLGQSIDPEWEKVRTHLASPVAIDSIYMGIGNAPDSYTNPKNMQDHPMVLGTLGMLPKWEKVDQQIMRNTLNLIMRKWDWQHTWGWDYPMVAMCATRLLEPEMAVDVLLKDVQKNTYLVNGHNYQDERLRIYLPGNGGLLKAVALMCAGWEGCEVKNPGFPKDGTWDVKWEGLNKDF